MKREGRSFNALPVLLTASTECAMTVLDTNIVAIVLPSEARDLGASFAEVEGVISTYVPCFAALLLPAGTIADRFGRRKGRLCHRKKEGLMNVTAIRVEEIDQRIIAHDLEVVGNDDRPGAAHREPDGRTTQCSA